MNGSATGRRGRLRQQHPALYAGGVVALVASLVAIVVVADPLGAMVSALPWPDLPDLGLPDLPDWATWFRRGIVVAVMALAVIGAVGKARERERSAGEDGG